MSNKVTKSLASLRVTLVVISLLGVMCLLGLWIPQERLISDAILGAVEDELAQLVATLKWLGFLHIYSSPSDAGAVGSLLREPGAGHVAADPAYQEPHRHLREQHRRSGRGARVPVPAVPIPSRRYRRRRIVVAPLKRTATPWSARAGGSLAVKNRLSPIAFGLFHLSFFLILIGGVVSIYTQFIGIVTSPRGDIPGGHGAVQQNPAT